MLKFSRLMNRESWCLCPVPVPVPVCKMLFLNLLVSNEAAGRCSQKNAVKIFFSQDLEVHRTFPTTFSRSEHAGRAWTAPDGDASQDRRSRSRQERYGFRGFLLSNSLLQRIQPAKSSVGFFFKKHPFPFPF